MALSKGFELATLGSGLDVNQSTGEVVTISMDTDVVSEGITNLYFTNERVDDRVANLLVGGSNITVTYDDTAGTLTIAGQSGYSDSDVDTHLNLSGASTNQVLSWNGSDYAWVNNPEPTGDSNRVVYDLSDPTNSVVLDPGSTSGAATYKGDVLKPDGTVIVDVSSTSSTFTGGLRGNTYGDVYNPTGANKILESGTGNLDSVLTVDSATITTLNATTTNISGIATFTGSSVDFTGTTTMGSWNGPVYDRTGGTLIIEDDATPNPIVHADLDGDVTGNITSSGSSEFSGTVDFTGASVSGLPSGGSGLQSRSTVTGTTSSLADAAEADLDITGFKAYTLLTITTDRAARVRLYVNNATRTADAARAEGVDPTSDAGLIAEVITTGADTVIISPGAYGFNLESSPTTTIPCRVTNKSGSASTVKVDLNILQLEA